MRPRSSIRGFVRPSVHQLVNEAFFSNCVIKVNPTKFKYIQVNSSKFAFGRNVVILELVKSFIELFGLNQKETYDLLLGN